MFGLRDWRPITPGASPLQRSASQVLTMQISRLDEQHAQDAEQGTEGEDEGEDEDEDEDEDENEDGVHQNDAETSAHIDDQAVDDSKCLIYIYILCFS